MKNSLFFLLLIIFSCKNDDCSVPIESSNPYPKLVEAGWFSFSTIGYEGVNCTPLLYVSLDSFKTEELLFALDSLPRNIVADGSFSYKGILKIEDRYNTCFDPISETFPNVEIQYANILYWELL
jgi:hypothetical protein